MKTQILHALPVIAILMIHTMIDAWGQGSNDSEKGKIKVAAYDGILAAGFVDGGGFTNFTGPNINMTYGDSKYILSALPSLRYKKDNSEPRNAFVTPNLGIGFTYSYKLFAIQIPLFYNPKTATENGSWHVGIGLGLRLNYL
ncbi:hypothetical protein [Shivajiella indica]|uniref:Porin n=1 Tax=Shivajiella indica TaxID=872115 RepID=A0ABW5B3L7_9BACT